MAGIQEFKCPYCGGRLEFNSAAQMMKCPYCDSTIDMAQMAQYDAPYTGNAGGQDMSFASNTEPAGEGANAMPSDVPPESLQWNTHAQAMFSGAEADQMVVYGCSSCGGEIVADKLTGATSCPFCGNTVIVPSQFSGALRPDYVIPFKLDKEAAKEALKGHLKGKKLLPKVFKDDNHIDEIKGLYVPFWLFDTYVDADLQYDATRVRHWSDSQYNYTETNYYSLWRGGNIAFDNIPADGSSRMPDDLMESIEPYDFSQAVPFQTAYLSGYMADKYDVDAQTSSERANERVRTSTQQAFASTITGYTGVSLKNSSIRLSGGKAKYAMYPVWILNTTWKGDKYLFAMNGQTGKFVGDLPTDKGAYWRYFGLTTGITAAIVFLLQLIIWLVR